MLEMSERVDSLYKSDGLQDKYTKTKKKKRKKLYVCSFTILLLHVSSLYYSFLHTGGTCFTLEIQTTSPEGGKDFQAQAFVS